MPLILQYLRKALKSFKRNFEISLWISDHSILEMKANETKSKTEFKLICIVAPVMKFGVHNSLTIGSARFVIDMLHLNVRFMHECSVDCRLL